MPRSGVIQVVNILFLFLLKQKYKNYRKQILSVGIDVGLKDFAILSDGTVYNNPKYFRTLEKKLAKAQRILSRRKEQAFVKRKFV